MRDLDLVIRLVTLWQDLEGLLEQEQWELEWVQSRVLPETGFRSYSWWLVSPSTEELHGFTN